MNAEYRYLMILAFWVFLWVFVPFIALPLFIIVMVRHFVAVRKQRKQQEQAQALHQHDRHWYHMEGIQSTGKDPADWWKQ